MRGFRSLEPALTMLDYPAVAIDFMNHDHREFVDLRETLLARLGPADTAEIDGLLDELLAHTRRHFGDEEALMRETGFPPYAMHKGEHDSVLDDMAQRIEAWRTGRDAAALQDWLEREIGDWFVAHVSSMDFVTARFAASR